SPTDCYTLSLPAALPICVRSSGKAQGFRREKFFTRSAGCKSRRRNYLLQPRPRRWPRFRVAVGKRSLPESAVVGAGCAAGSKGRSEEHTSELESRENLVC